MSERKFTDAEIARAIELRKAGLSWTTIAAKLGYTSYHTLSNYCRRVMRKELSYEHKH